MMHKLLNKTSDTSVDLYLFGAIGRYCDIDTKYLTEQIVDLQKMGVTDLHCYLNSEGGEVIQGIALYNFLDSSNLNVTYHIVGIAASMAAVLVSNPKHTVLAAKHAKMMYHRVSGWTDGNADDMRNYAEMMEKFEDSLIDIIAGRMCKTKDEVKALFFDGKDHWLNADEALEMKLINGIEESDNVEEPDMKMMTSAHDVAAYFKDKLINKFTNTMEMNFKNIASALGLTDESEKAIVDKVNAMTTENQALQNRVAELEAKAEETRKAAVKALIDKAVAEKRIGEDEREDYTTIANTNMEQAERMIARRQPVAPIASQLAPKSETSTPKTWDELDREGGLINLKKNNPEEYQRLFNEKFHPKN